MASAHGGVVLEEDVCVLTVGFMKAHFTGYQPGSSGDEEFCEDIPQVGESVFVIDYLHDYLREMRVDFRIIRDVNELGIYTTYEEVSAIADVEGDTVKYVDPIVYASGVLTAEHHFAEAGDYIGMITARHPIQNKLYTAVFPFEVGGGAGISYLPIFAGLLVLIQLSYWAISGTFTRLLKARFSRA